MKVAVKDIRDDAQANYNGSTIKICPQCQGKGKVLIDFDDVHPSTCPMCNGTGRIKYIQGFITLQVPFDVNSREDLLKGV